MVLAAILLLAGLLLISGNLVWFTVRLDSTALEVQGQQAAQPLSGLALASAALAGALSLAPRALRLVLGVVQLALGVLAALTVLPALSDPVGRVAARVTEATGVEGVDSVRAILAGVDATAWPVVALIAAVLSGLLGIVVLVTGGRWPTPGRRYAAPASAAGQIDRATSVGEGAPGRQNDGRTASADPSSTTASEPAPEDEWDALTRGEDPTSR